MNLHSKSVTIHHLVFGTMALTNMIGVGAKTLIGKHPIASLVGKKIEATQD